MQSAAINEHGRKKHDPDFQLSTLIIFRSVQAPRRQRDTADILWQPARGIDLLHESSLWREPCPVSPSPSERNQCQLRAGPVVTPGCSLAPMATVPEQRPTAAEPNPERSGKMSRLVSRVSPPQKLRRSLTFQNIKDQLDTRLPLSPGLLGQGSRCNEEGTMGGGERAGFQMPRGRVNQMGCSCSSREVRLALGSELRAESQGHPMAASQV